MARSPLGNPWPIPGIRRRLRPRVFYSRESSPRFESFFGVTFNGRERERGRASERAPVGTRRVGWVSLPCFASPRLASFFFRRVSRVILGRLLKGTCTRGERALLRVRQRKKTGRIVVRRRSFLLYYAPPSSSSSRVLLRPGNFCAE